MGKYALILSGEARHYKYALPMLISKIKGYENFDVYISSSMLVHCIKKDGISEKHLYRSEIREVMHIVGKNLKNFYFENDTDRTRNRKLIEEISQRMDRSKESYSGQIWQWIKAYKGLQMIISSGIKYELILYSRMDIFPTMDIDVTSYNINSGNVFCENDLICLGNFNNMVILLNLINEYGRYNYECKSCYCSELQQNLHLIANNLNRIPLINKENAIIIARYDYVDNIGKISEEDKNIHSNEQKKSTE